jgi:hypothetical protein
MVGRTPPVNMIDRPALPSTMPGLCESSEPDLCASAYASPHLSPTDEVPPPVSGSSAPRLPNEDGRVLEHMEKFHHAPAHESAAKRVRREDSCVLSSSSSAGMSSSLPVNTSVVGSRAGADSCVAALQPVRGSGLQGRSLRVGLPPSALAHVPHSRPSGPSPDSLMDHIRSLQHTQSSAEGACQNSTVSPGDMNSHKILHDWAQSVGNASRRDEVGRVLCPFLCLVGASDCLIYQSMKMVRIVSAAHQAVQRDIVMCGVQGFRVGSQSLLFG